MEASVHLITCHNDMARNIVKAVERCGLKVDQLIFLVWLPAMRYLLPMNANWVFVWSISVAVRWIWRSGLVEHCDMPK